jgi:hypothetical protein
LWIPVHLRIPFLFSQALADKATLLEQDFLAAKATVEKLRTRQAELRAKLLRIAAKLEQLSSSSASSSSMLSGGLSAGALQQGLEGAAARRCVIELRKYLLQESQLRERIDQLLLIQRMHSDAAAYANAASTSSSSALALTGLPGGIGGGAMVRTMHPSAAAAAGSSSSSAAAVEDADDLRALMRQLSLHGKGIDQVLSITKRDIRDLQIMQTRLMQAKALIESERERTTRGGITGGGGFGGFGFAGGYGGGGAGWS